MRDLRSKIAFMGHSWHSVVESFLAKEERKMPTISKRVTSKGKVHYRVQVRLKGYPVRMGTFETKKEALDWARDVEDGLRKGRLGVGAPDRTFAELLDRFEERRLLEMPRVDHGYRGHLRWWRKELGGHFLRQITTSMVRAAKE